MPVQIAPVAAGRVCARCGLWKPTTEFHSGERPARYCKPCAREYNREWRKANPDKVEDNAKLQRARYPERYAHLRRRANLKKHGVTADVYDAMLVAQGGVCAICGRAPERRRLSIDHDHKTGKVRGLLCDKCNPALGSFEEDVGRLARAIQYLEVHRGR
jgi:adenine-specific DNA methylase